VGETPHPLLFLIPFIFCEPRILYPGKSPTSKQASELVKFIFYWLKAILKASENQNRIIKENIKPIIG
jgi:hypothetical protein